MSLDFSTHSGRFTDVESSQGASGQREGLEGEDPWDCSEIPPPPRTAAHPKEYEWKDGGFQFSQENNTSPSINKMTFPHISGKEHGGDAAGLESVQAVVVTDPKDQMIMQEPLATDTGTLSMIDAHDEPSSSVSDFEKGELAGKEMLGS